MQLLAPLQGNSVYNVPDVVQNGSQKSTHTVSYWVKSDRGGEISYDILYMPALKSNDTNELPYKTETDSENEFMVAGGEGVRDS